MNRSLATLACLGALGLGAPAWASDDQGLLETIERLRTDERWQSRSEAAMQLGRSFDIRARRPLVRALEDSHYGVRAAAIRALVSLGDVRAVPSLLDALSDDEPFVRAEARRALDQFEPSAERPFLVHALRHHPDPRARMAAAERLAAHLDPDNEEALLEATAEPDEVGRYATSVLLGLPKDKALGIFQFGLRHVDYRVQIASAQSLAILDLPEAAAPIIELLDAQIPDVTIAAARAIRDLGHHVDEPLYLVLARRSKDRLERVRALKVVGALGGDEASKLLLNAVDDPDVMVRGAAVSGLGMMRELKAIPKLTEMKKHEENARIRSLVRLTLASLIRSQEESTARP